MENTITIELSSGRIVEIENIEDILETLEADLDGYVVPVAEYVTTTGEIVNSLEIERIIK